MLSTVLFCSSECPLGHLTSSSRPICVNYCVCTQDWGWCVCEAIRGGAGFKAANRFQGSDVSGVNGRLPRELITEHFQSVFIQLCLSTSLHVNHKTACERGVSQLTALISVRKKMDVLLYFTKSHIGTKAQKEQRHVQTDVAVTAAGNNQISWLFTHLYSYYLETSAKPPFSSF